MSLFGVVSVLPKFWVTALCWKVMRVWRVVTIPTPSQLDTKRVGKTAGPPASLPSRSTKWGVGGVVLFLGKLVAACRNSFLSCAFEETQPGPNWLVRNTQTCCA